MINDENKKALLGALLAVSLTAVVVIPAYAISISGVVRQVDFSTLADPKITAERVGEYKWTRGTSTGSYSVGVDTTNNYSVDAMKSGYQHNRINNVPGGSTSQNFILGTRSYATLDVRIAADEEFRNLHGANWQTQAENKLRLAEGWMVQGGTFYTVQRSRIYGCLDI